MILTPMLIADAPTCNTPNAQATVVNAVIPDYPDSAKDLGLGPVTVLIVVTVNADGNLLDAHIQQSSHNSALDYAALRAARQSTYSPTIVNCEATTGATIFRALMDPSHAPSSQQYVSCPMPNRPPYVTKAVPPTEPSSVERLPGPVTVRVRVTVGPDGSVRDARVFQSSNDKAVDDAVVSAARASQYAPQILACVPVTGTYILSASFAPH